jgi:hypothetical protein
MQNLIELSNDVKDLMEQLTDIGASRERLQALNTRATQIQKIREVIDNADVARAVLEKAKVELRGRPSASKKLIKKCHQVMEGFETNWEKIVRDKTLSSTFIDHAKDHAEKKIAQELKQDWRNFVAEMSPPITRDWLDNLPNSGPLGDAKEAVSVHLAELQELRADLPEDTAVVARVREVSGAAANIFGELDDIPEAVRNFLMSASGAGAKIDDLTDDIRAWMTEHDMMDRLRIRLG